MRAGGCRGGLRGAAASGATHASALTHFRASGPGTHERPSPDLPGASLPDETTDSQLVDECMAALFGPAWKE